MCENESWYPSEEAITGDDWDQFRQRYYSELGLESDPGLSEWAESQIIQEHPAFRGTSSNWAQLMPADSVPRLKSKSQTYETLKNIIEQTAQKALGDITPEANDLFI